jgi:hypothetical protein
MGFSFIGAKEAPGLTLSCGYRGGFDNLAYSSGLGLNLRLVPKLSIAGSYGSSSIDASNEVGIGSDFWQTYHGDSDTDVQTARIKRTLGQLQLRFHPMGGTFFLAAGVGKTESTGHLFVRGRTDGTVFERRYSGDGSFMTASLGNLWDTGTIWVGFEWAGITRRITYEEKITATLIDSSTEMASKANNTFQDLMKAYNGSGGLTLLIFYLGISI